MNPGAGQPDHDPAAQNQRGYELHLNGRLGEAEEAYREAVRLDPSYAEAWSNLGLALQAQRRLAEAEICQQHALRLAADYPEAHNNLGLAQYEQGRVAEAENSFRGALRLRPGYANAMTNLGTALQSLNRLEEAEACYRQALALDARPAQVLNNLGLLLQERGRPEEAEAACRQSLAHAPGGADARTNLALILLLKGEYEEGWREYEARWEVGAMAKRGFTQPRWSGDQPLEGRTILLHAEQGFGDTLQFCRYVPLVARAGARVVLEAQPALCRLLASIPGLAAFLAAFLAPNQGGTGDHAGGDHASGNDTAGGHAGGGAVIPAGEALPAFDLHCPLMSLPLALGTTLDTIPADVPYLRADPSAVAAWRGRLAGLPGRRIGVVWGGSSRLDQPHAAAIDRRRSMPLAALAPLADLAGCSFVSLQLGPPARQPAPSRLQLYDPTAELRDWADTAALVQALDLVISVDTAVAHLAAALGKPVWLLNRYDTCWRWLLGRDDSPWYPTVRQFRQPAPGDWATPVARIAQALAQEHGS